MSGIPLLVTRGGELITGRGYRVYGPRRNGRPGEELRASYAPGGSKQLLASTALGCRVAREGIHRLYETPGGDWIAIAKGMILHRRPGEARFRLATDGFRGSRPLYLGFQPESGNWYFGEYFANTDRSKAVHIYRSRTGARWQVAYTFPPGSIRHVHNIVWDSFRRGLWVLTGDRDHESGLWFTADDFATLRREHGGSQAYRAVSLLLTERWLLVPSDTPLERNAIRRIDRATGAVAPVAELASSAFHTYRAGDGHELLVTTVGEPSAVNDSNHAYLYASADGARWVQRSRFPRDVWSKLSCFLFRYPEVIPVGHTPDGVLHCVGIALSDCGYGHLQIKLR